MESITIKKTIKGVWMKRFNDYEKSFSRISKTQALADIANAREKGSLYHDDQDIDTNLPLIFGYWN